MAIPIIYNLRSVRVRWISSLVAIVGIAGTVGVFIAMLSLANGFRATLVNSSSPNNALIIRTGATSETTSSVSAEQVHVIEDDPAVARDNGKPLLSREIVAIAAMPLKATGTDANVQIRGVSENALKVRPSIHMTRGTLFKTGLQELIIGKNVSEMYSGLELGRSIKLGGGDWRIVGVFDAGGSAFDSEVWGDSSVVAEVFKRPNNVFQSVTVHLITPDAIHQLRDRLSADPRMTVSAEPEIAYYQKQSQGLTILIQVLCGTVALIMGLGAVIGALNTMYSAIADRSREIATMRAIGFRSVTIVTSFLLEAILIAGLGGLIGVLIIVPLNG
jgi:putative ABC transport system permease protein